MNMRRFGCMVLAFTLFAVLDGFVLGLFATFLLQPAAPTAEFQPETDEYVLLIGDSFAYDHDLAAARQRLSVISPEPAIYLKLISDQAQRDPRRAAHLHALAAALGASQTAQQSSAVDALTPTATLVVAQAAATETPMPTRTPQPTNTPPAPTATATRKATNTLVVRATATPTRRPPTATATPKVVDASVPAQPTATPNIDYKLMSVRRLTACENGGNHHLFILVLDQNGSGVPNVPIEVYWGGGSFRDWTGRKNESLPALGVNARTTTGYVNYPMYKGSYRVRVADALSEQTDWLTVDIPRDELCAAKDNPVGNSLYHYSYLIVFQKMR